MIREDEIIHHLKVWMMSLSERFTVDQIIIYMYRLGLIIAGFIFLISIIMLMIKGFKKKFDIKYIYAMIIAISVLSLFTLLEKLFLNQYTLRSLINYVMIIILSFILIIILAIINYFINKNKKSDQLQPIDYDEFKNQLLGKCEICHKQYKRKDIVKKDGHQYCKYCIKKEDS